MSVLMCLLATTDAAIRRAANEDEGQPIYVRGLKSSSSETSNVRDKILEVDHIGCIGFKGKYESSSYSSSSHSKYQYDIFEGEEAIVIDCDYAPRFRRRDGGNQLRCNDCTAPRPPPPPPPPPPPAVDEAPPPPPPPAEEVVVEDVEVTSDAPNPAPPEEEEEGRRGLGSLGRNLKSSKSSSSSSSWSDDRNWCLYANSTALIQVRECDDGNRRMSWFITPVYEEEITWRFRNEYFSAWLQINNATNPPTVDLSYDYFSDYQLFENLPPRFARNTAER